MNEKITFPRLATMLAERSGRSKRFSEDFLREFFAVISETLEAGESVKVKGLGTFRLSRVEPRKSVDVTTGQPMEISGHSKVVFIPAKELAEAVNAPFEAFTAIEIGDDADISQLFSQEDIALQSQPYDSSEEEESAEEPAAEMAVIFSESMTSTESLGSSEKSDISEESGISEESEISDKSEDEESEGPQEDGEEGEDLDYEDLDPKKFRRNKWKKILLVSLGAALFALVATFAIWYLVATNDFHRYFNRISSNTQQPTASGLLVGKETLTPETGTLEPAIVEDTTVEPEVAVTEETEVPTAPSDALVYDTVSTTRYLTTIAKAHYGNYNLWPYIYEENKAILGHPDRIRPGTPVVVPKLSKYGVDPTKKEDVEKAKKMGVEIYARYGKKI